MTGYLADSPREIQRIVTILGSAALVGIVLCVLWWVISGVRTYIFSSFLQPDLRKKFGTWAVVTGSTDGVGKAYSLELAKRGLNIVLISRNPEKLEKTALEIEASYKVQTKIIVSDFSHGPKIYPKIEKELKDVPVGILVNNVGVAPYRPKYVYEMLPEEIWNEILVNIGATTMMTRLLLPGMKRRGRGAIVNISSLVDDVPFPLVNIYAATKAYVRHFTGALQFECRNTGIVVQRLSPGLLATNMTRYSPFVQKSYVGFPDGKKYASSAVNTLGVTDNTPGYWIHSIILVISKLLPQRVKMYIVFLVLNMYRIESNEYLEKQQQRS